MSNSNDMPVAPAGASGSSSANDAKNGQESSAQSAASGFGQKNSSVAGASSAETGAHSVKASSDNQAGSSIGSSSFGASSVGSSSAGSTSASAGVGTSAGAAAAAAGSHAGAAAGTGTSASSPTGSTAGTGSHTATAGASFNQANTQAQAKFAQQANQQANAQKKAKKAKKQGQGGFGKAFAGGIIGAVVAIIVFVCLWQFTPLFGTKTATVSSSGGTITINGDTEATTAEAVGAKDLSSVVTIYVYSSSSSDWSQLFNNNNSSSNSNSPSALGSGVIVKKDDTYSYIVTNFHVVENTTRAVVSVGDTQVEAESVGYDAKSDLAVIKIKKTDTTVAEWGDSANLHVGQWVAAIGSPYGYEQTLTTGVVSALYRSDVLSSSSSSLSGTTVYTDMIQTDASINPGNSGGGLFDAEGKLIGINTYISSTSQSSAGLGFAIPQASAQSAVETLISGQTVTHAFLGVALGTSSTNPAGATVGAVYKDTAAAQAGLKTGDIITKIDDKSMSSASDVTKAVAAKKVGDEITITYVRNGQEATTKAKLGDDTGSNTEYADGGAPANSGNSSGSGNSKNYNFGNSGNSGNGSSGNSGSGNSGSGNSGSGSSLFDYLWGNSN